MKYIIKNYKYFIRRDPSLFFLAVISIMVSVLIIHFSYGLYQNYHIIWDGNKSWESENNYISFTFSEKEGKEVTKADLDRCFKRVSEAMYDIQASGNSDFALFTCYSNLDWGYKMDTESELKMIVDHDGIKAPTIVFKNMETYDFSDGSGWTDEDEKKGSRVALFWDYNQQTVPNDNYVNPVCALREGNTVTIDGKNYQIIGYQTWVLTPMIPYSSLDDDVVFTRGRFAFVEWVSETTFQTISGIFKEELGDRVTVLDENRDRWDAHYVYRTVILIVALLTVIAVMDFIILYTYFLKKRKKTIGLFRICGLSRWKGILLQLSECLVLTIPVYAVSVCIFAFCILPGLKPYFVYMGNAFDLKIYGILFGIYAGCSLLACLAVVWKESRNSIVEIIKQGV